MTIHLSIKYQPCWLIYALVFSFFWTESLAQDPQYSQFYSAPYYMNPGFAGNTIQARGVLNFRDQWPAMPGRFVSYSASFDYNIEDLNSGLAVGIQQDKAGSAGLRFTNIGAMYSYNIRLSRKIAVKPGMSFSFAQRDVDRTQLLFGDQIVYENPISVSTNYFTTEPVRYPDFGVGSILYSRGWWSGIAFHHLNRPNQSLLDDEIRLPIRLTIHGGYSYVLKRGLRKKPISTATAVAHYKSQGKWDQMDLGVYYKYKVITAGFYYRGLPLAKRNGYKQPNQDALIAMLGFEYKDFGLAYSYDLTLSKLITSSGGAHEVSMVWEMASKRKKRKNAKSRHVIPCAKF